MFLTKTLIIAAMFAGGWTLDSDKSVLSFVSIKNKEVAETHRFQTLEGVVAEDGSFDIRIPLSSVETGIEIRNTRMRDLFFQIDRFSAARIEGSLDISAYDTLAVGDSMVSMVEATLYLHGQSVPVMADVHVTHATDNKVVVSTVAPVLLHVADFGLLEGLRELQSVAGLDSISPVVPVSFNLVFQKD